MATCTTKRRNPAYTVTFDGHYVRVIHPTRGLVVVGELGPNGRVRNVAFLDPGDVKINAIRMPAMKAMAAWEKKHLAGRTNPAPAAAALYESWTGLPSNHETVVVEKVFDHGHLTDLARLVSFKLRGVRGQLKFTDPTTRLCVNESGTQLYIRGGDQAINLDDFNRVVTSPSRKVDPTKESIVLGEITNVYYAARKPFLGGEHKHLGVYDHKLGGKHRNYPTLVYDSRSQLLSISGGVYYIKPDDYDGKHSRGIVD